MTTLKLWLLTQALALACAASSIESSASQDNIARGTLLSMEFSIPGGDDRTDYYLTTDGDEAAMYRLAFCEGLDLASLAPRSRVAVRYTSIESGVMTSCQVPQLLPAEQQQQQGPASRRRTLFGDSIDAPTRPTFLVYIVNMCGYTGGAAPTPEALRQLFFGSRNGTSRNLADYYDTCSYGQVRIERPEQVTILDPFQLPCSGKVTSGFTFSSGNTMTTTDCLNENQFKWHYYLDGLARDRDGITATDYHHKILVLPKGFASKPGCNGFAGTGTVGPWFWGFKGNSWGTGLVWLSGDAAGSVEMLFHELGHNLGMQHADVPGGCSQRDQCDHTCPMGATGGQGIRCLNPPHMWQLGWGQPFKQLAETDLAVGAVRVLTLPPQMSSNKAFATVSLPSSLPDNTQLFLAARINAYDYDLPYVRQLNGQPFITVHSYAGTPADKNLRTVLLADVARDDVFVHADSGLVVSFTRWDPVRGATVALCRRLAANETTCGDGVDDDCDGLPDDRDPDCANRPSPPPPRAPRAPRSPPQAPPQPPPSPSPPPPPLLPPPSPVLRLPPPSQQPLPASAPSARDPPSPLPIGTGPSPSKRPLSPKRPPSTPPPPGKKPSGAPRPSPSPSVSQAPPLPSLAPTTTRRSPPPKQTPAQSSTPAAGPSPRSAPPPQGKTPPVRSNPAPRRLWM